MSGKQEMSPAQQQYAEALRLARMCKSAKKEAKVSGADSNAIVPRGKNACIVPTDSSAMADTAPATKGDLAHLVAMLNRQRMEEGRDGSIEGQTIYQAVRARTEKNSRIAATCHRDLKLDASKKRNIIFDNIAKYLRLPNATEANERDLAEGLADYIRKGDKSSVNKAANTIRKETWFVGFLRGALTSVLALADTLAAAPVETLAIGDDDGSDSD